MSTETSTNPQRQFVEAISLLARVLRQQQSGATVPCIASQPARPADTQQVIQQTARSLIGLRSGFTTDDLIKGLSDRFKPVEDTDNGVTTFEYVPPKGSDLFTDSEAPEISVSPDQPDEIEAQFQANAQDLLTTASALIDLVQPIGEFDPDAVEMARQVLTTDLNCFVTSAFIRPDAYVFATILRQDLDRLGTACQLVTASTTSGTPISTPDYSKTVREGGRKSISAFLLLGNAIHSLIDCWTSLQKLQASDLTTAAERLGIELQMVCEVVRAVYDSTALGEGISELRALWADCTPTDVRHLPATVRKLSVNLYDVLQSTLAFAGSEAANLLSIGGVAGLGSVLFRAEAYLNLVACLRTSINTASGVALGTFSKDSLLEQLSNLESALAGVCNLARTALGGSVPDTGSSGPVGTQYARSQPASPTTQPGSHPGASSHIHESDEGRCS